MMKRAIRFFVFVLALFMIMSFAFVGCKKNDEQAVEPDGETGELEFVKLKWYIIQPDNPDIPMVVEAANKVFKEKLNVEVEFITSTFADYDQKMQMIIASGEEFDLCYTGNWINNYYTNVGKSAFLPVDDLTEDYCQDAIAAIPEIGFESFKLDGVPYAFPTYQIWGRTSNIICRNDMIEKYGLDVSAVKSFKDLTPFFERVYADNPDKVLYGLNKFDKILKSEPFLQFESIAGSEIPGAVEWGDGVADKFAVINQFKTDQFREFLELHRSWYEAGYIAKDAATVSSLNPGLASGKVLSRSDGTYKPGYEAFYKQNQFGGNFDVTAMPLGESYISTNAIVSSGVAISQSSKNPERAAMVYNLIYQDRDLARLLFHGMEGRHYEKISDSQIRMSSENPYKGIFPWEFANQFDAYILEGQPENVWDMHKELNNTAVRSVILGFAYNPEAVKTEIAKCTGICNEYMAMLLTGSFDVDKVLPEFLEKLDTAGADIIIEDIQTQLDAWRKANGK